MDGGDYMDEVDCNSFFDQMDDLVEFPADTDSALFSSSGGSSDISSIWSNPLPYEDIAQLEWLSTFVEDSFSGEGLTITNDNIFQNKESSSENSQTSSPVSTGSSCRGVRTKRPRPATFNPPSSFPVSGKKLPKNKKIKPTIFTPPVDTNNQNSENVRKCMHCEITKTPQWRTGPMGPKTLCNACGVRYKSGRLFPEYRPAASPTFVPSVHSNSHRKVLEMRTRCDERSPKETTDLPLEIVPNTTPLLD